MAWSSPCPAPSDFLNPLDIPHSYKHTMTACMKIRNMTGMLMFVLTSMYSYVLVFGEKVPSQAL